MLLTICGEDTVSSRNYLVLLKKQYSEKGYEVKDLTAEELLSFTLSEAQSPSLFFEKRVIFCDSVSKHIKKNSNLLSELKKIEKSALLNLINWEKESAWELRFPKVGTVKEFKPSHTIFKLADSLFPTNKRIFLANLESFMNETNEHFVFSMINKLVRNLLIIKTGEMPTRMQAWQAGKLRRQAAFWKLENLLLFYGALYKIDVGIKTSSIPYSIKESLAILACHFL